MYSNLQHVLSESKGSSKLKVRNMTGALLPCWVGATMMNRYVVKKWERRKGVIPAVWREVKLKLQS